MGTVSPFRNLTAYLVLGLAGLLAVACGQSSDLVTAQPQSNFEQSDQGTFAPTLSAEVSPQPAKTLRSSQQIEADFNSPLFDYTWATDFSKHTIPFDQIRFIGLERDGITPIYTPEHIPVVGATKQLIELEPVIVVEVKGETRAYPESTLILHEVVNDVLGGLPIAVTW